MDWHRYSIQLFYDLSRVLPWLLGALVSLGALSVSPLGKALIGHLRARREEGVLLEELLAQVAAMREELAETTERLDGTDRLLRAHQQPPALNPNLAPPPAPTPLVTPH
jgi:hypothetical protein